MVTAPLYNNAHKNQQANDIPTSAGAHSDDLTQFQATTDPAPSGTPTPVLSLAEELEQYRFVIADIKEFLDGSPPAEWYSDFTANATAFAARGARIVRTTNQTITISTPTALSFDGVRYDTGVVGGDDFYSAGQPTRLTAPVGGLYHMIGFAPWASANGNVALLIRVNGTTVIGTINNLADTSGADINEEVSASFVLAATDYVELIALQTAAATLAVVLPEFGIELLNPTATVPAPGTFVLTILEAGAGTGVVTSDVGAINCPGVCNDTYAAATVVNLTANPSIGNVFAGWTGDVSPVNQFDNPLAVTMSADKTITATFEIATVTTAFSGGLVVLSGTIFGAPITSMIGGLTATSCNVLNIGARTLRRLTVAMTTALGGGQQVTAQFSVNGVDQAGILLTISTLEQSDFDEGSVTLADGDLFCIKFVQSGGGSNAVQSVSFVSST